MRLNDKITLYTSVLVPDGYGGYIESLVQGVETDAVVSVSNNELKPLPSGRGFNRIITVIVSRDADISKGCTIMRDGIMYTIEHEVPYESSLFTCWKGYEV